MILRFSLYCTECPGIFCHIEKIMKELIYFSTIYDIIIKMLPPLCKEGTVWQSLWPKNIQSSWKYRAPATPAKRSPCRSWARTAAIFSSAILTRIISWSTRTWHIFTKARHCDCPGRALLRRRMEQRKNAWARYCNLFRRNDLHRSMV